MSAFDDHAFRGIIKQSSTLFFSLITVSVIQITLAKKLRATSTNQRGSAFLFFANKRPAALVFASRGAR